MSTPSQTQDVPSAAVPITWGVTAVVAVAGVVMSADMLVTLASLSGWGKYTAWLLPVLLDGSGIAGGLTQKFGPTPAARRYGAVVLGESAVLSVLGNVAGHTIDGTTAPVFVAAAVAVAVPVQIVLTVHQGILLSTPAAPAATTAATAETPAATPAAPTPAPVAAEPAEPAESTRPAAVTATVEGQTETPAVSVSAATETPDRDPATQTATPAPAEAVESPAAPVTETARRVVPFRRPEIAAAPLETTSGPEAGETDSEASGGAQGAMWDVWRRHLEAGTADELTGAQLAREAGRGSRQLAGRYLTKWREQQEVGA